MKKTKLLRRALSGSKGIRFNEFVGLAEEGNGEDQEQENEEP